jgi:large subunit ribosomal protein L17
MRHLNSGSKLGKQPAHRRAVLRSLVTNLLEHGRITTTLTRAKATRPVAEKMITLGKRDTLQARRLAASYIMTPAVTKKLFSEIAPKFADRAGGYTRIIPVGIRVGDGAKVAILELVGYEFKKKEKKEKSKLQEAVDAKS